jgi:phage repressor protein C with HTH and peptisase S24 domain
MSERYERLKEARASIFPTAGKAAEALGMSASTYRAHENGQNDFDFEEAVRYAKLFQVNAIWLFTGAKNNLPNIDHLPNAIIGAPITGTGRMIHVYGRAVAGEDGEFEMNGTILFDVMAPPIIAAIEGAYAVQVSGDSMSPRFEDGEVVFIDPKQRVSPGDGVLVQIQQSEHGPVLAFTKRLVKHTTSEIILRQYNPQKEIRFLSTEVVSVHYIAGLAMAKAI